MIDTVMKKLAYDHYVAALLWVNEMDDKSESDFSEEAKETIKKWVSDFIDEALPILLESKYNSKQVGHDLCLTQFRHGAGFWEADHCSKEQGKQLTDLAHKLPEFASIFWDEESQTIILEGA